MKTKKFKLAVGFIAYGESTAKYLPYFLPSLFSQDFKDFIVLAIDNSKKKDNQNLNYIKKNYPEINFYQAGKNLGFARAYNIMIKEAAEQGVKYFFAVNPDLILEKNAINNLVKAIEKDGALGAVSPKVKKWDFQSKRKTDIMDTCGIKLLPGLRFVDVKQGVKDEGEFGDTEILGPSGAAGLYRISVLEKIKIKDEYFDELMFMYKEDCDLAYRLFLKGYRSVCVQDALAYHDRTVSSSGISNLKVAINRKNKSRQAKKWAFLNQQIIFLKFWRFQNWKNKLLIVWFEIKILAFILLFEQYLFFQFIKLFKIKKKIKIYFKY